MLAWRHTRLIQGLPDLHRLVSSEHKLHREFEPTGLSLATATDLIRRYTVDTPLNPELIPMVSGSENLDVKNSP
jgi:hypothetical protein